MKLRATYLWRAAPHLPIAALSWVLDTMSQGAYIVFCWLDGASQDCFERLKRDVTRKIEREEADE